MGVYIKEMKKPEACWRCHFYDKADGWCYAQNKDADYTDCPIIPTEINALNRKKKMHREINKRKKESKE